MSGQSMAGKTVVITGPTNGVGRATAIELGARGARMLLLCRSAERGTALAADIAAKGGSAEVVSADLASLQSVVAAAERVRELAPQFDVLINNAGVINNSRKETRDGLEEMFAVNHLAHFLLTARLLPSLRAAASARIVHVASAGHALVKGFDCDDYGWAKRKYATFPAYGHSKLANLLFNRSLAKRLAGSTITSNALHPGAVGSNMGANNGLISKIVLPLVKPFMLTPEQGAQTSVYLATDPAVAGRSGDYYIKCKVVPPKPWAEDDVVAERLWTLSVQLLNERGLASF